MLNYIGKWATENGFHLLKIYAEKDNIPSIKGILKAGFTPYEKITLFKLFVLKFYINSKLSNSLPV
jgi:hypothetical protein